MYRSLYPYALLLLSVGLWGETLQYGYDAAGRLVRVDYGDGRVLSYSYDSAGNLLKREWTSAPPAAVEANRPGLSFEANQGQIDSRFQYLARRANFHVAISAREAQFALSGATVRMEWLGANANAAATGLQPRAATSNYLNGTDPRRWRTGIPHYGSVRYNGIFPGVDAVYYGNPQHLEYDLIVHPGADPSAIQFRLDGATNVRLAPNGDLVFQAGSQTGLFKRPVLHQVVRGASRPVAGAYAINGDVVSFRIGAYDKSLPLVIDPVFADYTLAGGSGDDLPTAAVEDAQGFLYVVGTTNSTDIIGVQRAVQGANAGATDIFVMKLSHNTKALLWVTYLGGTAAETAGGIAIDRQGNLTISGTTSSQNFPVTPDAMQRTFGGGGSDGFVARLNGKGERLLYSTYLGGSGADAVHSVSVDAASVVVAAGVTSSANFNTRPGAVQEKHAGATDGFVVKFVPGDAAPVYSTFLGGAADDGVQRVVLDATGNAYVAGSTSSTNFPTTTGVVATANAGGVDGFVAKLNPAGAALVYSTYLGGSADDQILGLAVSGGAAAVSGVTASRNLPIRGSVFSGQFMGGATDGFLLLLSANGSQVTGGTYLGGNGADSAADVAIRTEGTLLVAVNGNSFSGEPARMYAFSPDLSRELGTQTISNACMGGEGRMVALTHSSTRSLAIGWARATAECNAPQWFSLPGGRKDETERMASSDRFSTGHVEMFVGASGSAPPAPPTPPAALPPASQYKSSGSAGDPFSTATGEHTDSFVDLYLSGPYPLNFRRYYSTAFVSNEIASGLGLNWSHNFDLALAVANGTAVATLEGGAKVTFRLVSGAWQMQPVQKSEYRLLESSNDFKLADIGRSIIITFNRRGQLTRMEDRNGNSLQITPAMSGPLEVRDSLGRSLKFTYGGGFLTQVQDQSGRTIRFGYRGEHLDGVTDGYGRVTRYEYQPSGRLLRHVLPAGNGAYANTYDATGRVVEQADAEGQPTKVAYLAAGVTEVTDPTSAVTRHTHNAAGDLVRVTDATGGVTEMTYDTAHRRTAVKDRLGNSTAIAYHAPTGMAQIVTDAAGGRTTTTFTAQVQAGFTFYNATRVEHPDGTSVAYEFDARGNPVTITDRAGKPWKYTYNAQGLPLTLTNPGGSVYAWTYNANGTVATVTTPTGDKTAFDRDQLGRIVKTTYADGAVRQYAYDAGDHLIQQTDENGKITKYGLDQNQQLTSVTDELGGTESRTYNPSRLPMQSTDRMGNKTSLSYNRNNLVSKVTDAAGGELEFVYDSLHRISAVKDAMGVRYQYGYNKEGEAVSAADGLGRTWAFEIDALGRMTKAVSPLGSAAQRTYNAAGRLTSTTNGAGEKSEYSYDARGKVSAIVAPGGLKTAMARNDNGAVTELTDASGAVWKNAYDGNGRLLSRTDPLDRKFEYSYDKRGELAGIVLPGELGSVALAYDPAGRLVGTRYSDGSELFNKRDDKGRVVEANGITLAYDANDRIVASNGVVTERDALGRVAAITYAPEKVVRYAYNARGQVTKITDWLGGETGFTYDAAGAMTGISRPNLVVTSYGYDGDGRLASIEDKKDETIGRISFAYDAADRVISEERTLPPVAGPASDTAEFSYDAASQRTDATYDAAGRLVADANRTVTWNAASRPTGFTSGDASVALAHDARGQLIARTAGDATTAYVVNYGMPRPVIAMERDAAGADLRYYVHLPNGKLLYSVDAASNGRSFYHFDRIGSTTFLTSDEGAVTDSYGITPYGEKVVHEGTSANPFTFLGAWGAMQQDNAGLYLLRFRLYDAATGRFLSRDPKLDVSPRAANPYQYALGNPVSYSDPQGLSAAAPAENFSNLGEFFRWLFSTPEGQQMMRDAERAEAEEAQRKQAEEEQERQRILREKARIEREALEAQQRFLLRFANARAMEMALWAATGFGSPFTCDLNLHCVQWSSLSKAQAKARTAALATQTSVQSAAKGGELMTTLSSRLIGLDGGTLIGLDGGTLIGLDGGTLIGLDGGTLIGLDGGTLIGLDGGTLVGNDGASLVGNDGAS